MIRNLDLFWISWLFLFLLAIVSCIVEGWSEDTALLGVTYALWLLSTWLCQRVKPRTAFGNLIVMIAYNAILSYNLIFNSRCGAGITWWFITLFLNTLQSFSLLVYVIFIAFGFRVIFKNRQ